MRGQPWTWQEEAYLKKHYASTTNQALAKAIGRSAHSLEQKAHEMGLRKSREHLAAMARRNGNGRATRFAAGKTPWNKGLAGYNPGGRSVETRFSPGNRPHSWVPVGTVKETGDGYLKIKIAEPNTRERVHRRVWKAAHGPIPPGHIVVFRDGDRRNTALENLELISLSENARRNQNPAWRDYPPALKEVIRLRQQLTKTINARRKHEKQDE